MCSGEDALYCLNRFDDINLHGRFWKCVQRRPLFGLRRIRKVRRDLEWSLVGVSIVRLRTSPICNPPSTPFSSVPHHLFSVSLNPFHQACGPSEIALWRSDRVNPALRIPVANLTCAASGGTLTQPDRSIHSPSSALDISVGKYISP